MLIQIISLNRGHGYNYDFLVILNVAASLITTARVEFSGWFKEQEAVRLFDCDDR